MTKRDLKNYIIDVLGYRDYELEDYVRGDLEMLVDCEGSFDDAIDYASVSAFESEILPPVESIKSLV